MGRKVPLQYQATEYDCGNVAIMNALNYVLDFSSIPAVFLKTVYNVCMNECNTVGMVGTRGTSIEAIRYLAKWFNDYSQKTGFPLKCKIYEDKDVTFLNDSNLLSELKKHNTAIVLYCTMYDEHYLTLTDADDMFMYLFDPYFWDIDFEDDRIIRINGKPLYANRRIPVDFWETKDGNYYTFKGIKNKFAVVFEKTE